MARKRTRAVAEAVAEIDSAHHLILQQFFRMVTPEAVEAFK